MLTSRLEAIVDIAFSAVPLRQLGSNGPALPAIALDLEVLRGSNDTQLSKHEQFRILDRAVALGCTFWNDNGNAENEELLSKWFSSRGKRDMVFLASKCDIPKERWTNTLMKSDSAGQYCKDVCNARLQRLGTGHIDLFYARQTIPDTPIDDTVRALAELKAHGKIRRVGLTGVDSATLRRASQIVHIDVVQLEHSPFDSDLESGHIKEILAVCRELGTSIVVRPPTAQIYSKQAERRRSSVSRMMRRLSRTSSDSRRLSRGSDDGDTESKLAEQWDLVADMKSCTAGQLSIAWLLKQGEYVFVLPSCETPLHLEENWKALDVEFTDKDEAEVRRFVASADV